MVGNAADSERLHVVGPRDPAHVSPEPRLELSGMLAIRFLVAKTQ
jgi:hypothetical protein